MRILGSYSSDCLFAPGDIVWSYLRYSTDDQNLDSQEKVVREWCDQYQLSLAKIYRDEAKSGKSTAGRVEFLQMVEDLENAPRAGRPAGVVFWNLARFARDFDDGQYYKSRIRRLKYQLQSISERIPPGLEGRLIESVKDYANAVEAKTRAMEAQRGMRALALDGLNSGGFPPLGYKRSAPILLGRKKNGVERTASKWEIDPEYEERVRLAFRMRLEGKPYWEIHRTTKLYKTINCWTTFFKNRTYAGYRKCGAVLTPNAHPAYISDEEYDRLQRMKRPYRGNPKAANGDPNHSRRLASPFLLSGLMYCSCGAAMIGSRDNGTAFYRCGRQAREGREICRGRTVVSWYVEQFVRDWIAAHVLTSDRMIAARDAINRRLSGDQTDLLSRRAKLEREQKRIDRVVENLIDAVGQSGFTGKFQQKIQSCQVEANTVAAELESVKRSLGQQRVELTDEAVEYSAHRMRALLAESGSEEARDLVRNSLVRLELDHHHLRILYAVPIAKWDRLALSQCPHGNSNPGFGLERATS